MSLRLRSAIRSPNRDERPPDTATDLIILHYTGMASAAAALSRLCDPRARVSAHYFVTEGGEVLELVDPPCRAWHAGVSSWEGRRNLNDSSVGIELVNPGHEWGYRPFPEPQMQALVGLLDHLTARYFIPAWRVIGHSDVAPRRKEDPGERFSWSWLAAHGFGLWPEETGDEPSLREEAAAAALAEIGYGIGEDCASLAEVVRAFQRHYCQANVTGRLDAPTGRRIEMVRRLCSARRAPS